MKALAGALALATLLAGCEDIAPERWATDQQMRREIFRDCLTRIPEGPERTHYNDWAEVIDTCDEVATFQARVCVANCDLPSNAPAPAHEAPRG